MPVHISTQHALLSLSCPKFSSYDFDSRAWCFGTHQECGVKDITLQPIRLVLCEKTNKVSNSAVVHLQK